MTNSEKAVVDIMAAAYTLRDTGNIAAFHLTLEAAERAADMLGLSTVVVRDMAQTRIKNT